MLEMSFKYLCVLGLLVAYGIRVPYLKRMKRGRDAEYHETLGNSVFSILSFVGFAVVPIVYAFSGLLSFADYNLPEGWRLATGIVGVFVFAAAIWLLNRAHADLGRSWSATLKVREEQELVTQGVYARVRHPIYAAHWLWGLAQLLLLHNWIAGPAMLVTFLPVYLYRIRNEEAMMQRNFGDVYRQYMARTPRVLPKL